MKSRKVLLFTAIVIALLAVLSVAWPREGLRIGGLTLRFPSLHKVLVREEGPSLDEILRQEEQERELATLCDSLDFYRQALSDTATRFWFPNDDVSFFDPLFAKMETAQADGCTIRILHYGDSQIEMDRISCRLRAMLQHRFGGNGPGLLPILQTIPSFAVSQYASGALAMQTSYGDSLALRANGNYGPMAKCFHLGGSASAGFNATRHEGSDSLVRRFDRATLIFNNRGGSLSATLANRTAGTSETQNNNNPGVGAMTWAVDSSAALRLSLSGNSDIYGIMLDGVGGVAVDNIPLRGCSGQQFSMINRQQLADAYALMDVGMIIMQFGGNSVPYLGGQKSRDIYCNSIGKQIDRLHEVCPNALILFIGPSDMAARNEEGDLRTYSYLPKVVSELRDTATAHGAAFWSIFDAMGGANSMPAWVSGGLAGSDYIHFSPKGADIMGDRLSQAFMRLYDFYLLRKPIPKTQFDSLWYKK